MISTKIESQEKEIEDFLYTPIPLRARTSVVIYLSPRFSREIPDEELLSLVEEGFIFKVDTDYAQVFTDRLNKILGKHKKN